jgi:hypothetical protein
MIDGVDTSRLKLVDGPERPTPSGGELPAHPEILPAEATDRHGPLSSPVTPLAGAVQYGLRALLEAPGAEWVIAFSGAGEPSSGRADPLVAAADRGAAPPHGRSEQPAPVPPVTVADIEPEGAAFITRFLPFDTAHLQQEVREFLNDLGTALEVVPERLFPGVWEAVAVLATGTGAVLVIERWRARSARPRQAVEPTALTVEEPGAV